jgi:hypothetical protein
VWNDTRFACLRRTREESWPSNNKEVEVLTKEEHATLLRSFEVDRLLKLVTLKAKRLHDGHFTVFAFTTHYKVAFGTPDLGGGKRRPPLAAMPGASTLKEALIAALVEGKDFDDYFAGDPDAWMETQVRSLTRQDWTLIEHVTGGRLRAREASDGER